MINKRLIILYFCLLGSLLTAQQTTYTSVPNIKDTFDYASQSFIFNGKTYLQRSYLPLNTFYSKVNSDGSVEDRYNLIPKLGFVKAVFYSTQIGNKLFMVGTEYDTTLGWGSLTIFNSDLSVYKDLVFYDHYGMEFDVCKYDVKRNKMIATYTYFKHKDSIRSRNWGMMELDTLGNFIRKKDMPTVSNLEMSENLIITTDGNYLVSGKMNGKTTYIDPFFVKIDTNFNVLWRTDLRSTGEKFFTQDYSENLLELPNNKGYVYVGSLHRNIDTITRKCWYYDYFTSLHFISTSGQITKNYYHNLSNPYCEGSRPKGLFLKNDSTLMIFTQRDTTTRINRREDSSSSLVIHYNFNQHRVIKEIIGGQLLNGKTTWVLPGYTGVCFRKYVGRDIDGGFLTSGWADINDNFGTAAYLMKTDSCGYTQDHKCKLVYKIDTLYGNTLKVHIIDSLSVLCQPIWTIEGKQYTSLDIIHNFSTIGIHTVKLWGFAGSTVDSLSFWVQIDSMNSRVLSANDKHIMIYPNPSSDYIHITNYPIMNHSLQVCIYDLLGREMHRENLNKLDTTIAVSSLDKGYYILVLKDSVGDIIDRVKLSIQR